MRPQGRPRERWTGAGSHEEGQRTDRTGIGEAQSLQPELRVPYENSEFLSPSARDGRDLAAVREGCWNPLAELGVLVNGRKPERTYDGLGLGIVSATTGWGMPWEIGLA